MRKQVRFLIAGMVSVFLAFGLTSCHAKPISDIDELKTTMQKKGYEVQTASYNDRSDGMISMLVATVLSEENNADDKITIDWHKSSSLSQIVDPFYEGVVVQWYESNNQAKKSYNEKCSSFDYRGYIIGKSKKMVYYATADFVLEDASS